MAFYESIFIARQELGEKDLENTVENFKKILENNNANLVDTESWGLRNLAYKIEEEFVKKYSKIYNVIILNEK